MIIIVAADHFGYEAKQVVMTWLRDHGQEFLELGSTSESDEQSIADFIPKVAAAVLEDDSNRGIMICGTGVGVDIGANRFRGIRSVLASCPKVAKWSRIYDNSNVLCLSGWDFDGGNVEQILTTWFDTPFEDVDGSKTKFLSAMYEWNSG